MAGWIFLLLTLGKLTALPAATITLQSSVLGPTPASLAYNAGHFAPGSNTKDWWHYAAVTGARVFISPSLIEPSDDIGGWGDGVTDQASFLSRRAALRANPLNTNYINWPYLTNRFGLTLQHGANILRPNYACGELQKLGISILICASATPGTFPLTSTNDWAGKWELWQHFYAEAFYLGKNFGVEKYQMYNEPNLDTITVTDFVQRLQLVSDAVQCALTDVNQLYGKTLAPQMFAPVSAGTASSTWASWGQPVVTNRHKDFQGQTSTNNWLIRTYDYHEYNSSPGNFGNNLASLNSSMTAAMSPEPRFPTAISEFNVHTAGVFATLTDTLDSPAQYAAFGAIVVNLVNNFCNELYVFKFSQTLYSDTVPIKKNGMMFVDNTNSPYNLGGITKAGEVWRLFNRGAAPGRTRLNLIKGTGATGVDALAAYDPAAQMYHVFAANDAGDVGLTFDTTAWGLPSGQPGVLREVSESCYGGVRAVVTPSGAQYSPGTSVSNTVWLLSVPARPILTNQIVAATEDAMVADGANRARNYRSNATCIVRNSSTNTANRSAALIKFHLPNVNRADIQFALLTVRASSLNGSAPVQAHVYGITNNTWSRQTVAWSNAPNLAQNISAGQNFTNNFVLGAGDSAAMSGQFVADASSVDRTIDVTDFIKSAPTNDVSFLVVRENRYYGDVQDADGMNIVSGWTNAGAGPRLQFIVAQSASNGAPVIVGQPTGVTVNTGSPATFSVASQGTSPLYYQWRFNGTTHIGGATQSSLTILNAQSTNEGDYSVIVSNTAGVAISSNAALTVLPIGIALPWYEGFAYTPGWVLNGQSGWVLNSGTSGTIESGSLSLNGLAASAGNKLTWGGPAMSLRLPLGATLLSGDVYFSFLLRVDTLGTSFNSTATIAGFTTGTGTAFVTKVNLQTNGVGGYVLGVSKSTGTTYGAWSATNFSPGETVFIVGRYRFVSGTGTSDLCDLWINPSPATFGAASPPSATLAGVGSGGNDLGQIDRFFFRSGGSSASPSKLVTDELRLGLDWASVTPPPPVSLGASLSGSSFALRWTTNLAGFQIQSTASLEPPVVWSNEPAAPVISGTNFQWSAGTSNDARYFRLTK